MRRREFIAGLGGTAAWPVVARAQQPPMPIIGLLGNGSADSFPQFTAAYREGLSAAGFVEGKDVLQDTVAQTRISSAFPRLRSI